eukprot:TRINITY_DN94995_c0_g1_i1.p1 TRINITY_DN94995_c0_g1~~TRINITY_DN94995_c0_g1_i1.p1  ORF type:complete len:157 (+),score=52.05 TRINITY_DN94995_c0_g1_i1:71-541(+)
MGKMKTKKVKSGGSLSGTAGGGGLTSDAGIKKSKVKKSIGKVKKTEPAILAGAATSAAGKGPRARRAAARAAAKAKADVKVHPPGRSPLLDAPKPKMNGALMIKEIEEAREFADKIAESARNGSRSKKKKRLGKHSQQVMAAFNAPSPAPVLPGMK